VRAAVRLAEAAANGIELLSGIKIIAWILKPKNVELCIPSAG
jgi:hypothetical protein